MDFTKDTLYDLRYVCRVQRPGDEPESGAFDATWTGEIDASGKYTWQPVNGGPAVYLFADEFEVHGEADAPAPVAAGPKHTPGPWEIGTVDGNRTTIEPGIAIILGLGQGPAANASLIAAAPELRDELLRLITYLESSCLTEGESDLLTAPRALLARIDGTAKGGGK